MAEWELDGDQLKARRPGIEPHVVHPGAGVVAVEDELTLPSERALGARWIVLPAEERRLRVRDMLQALLEEACAGGGGACFRVNGARAEPLDDAAISRLLDGVAGRTLVERDGVRWCEFSWRPGEPYLRAAIVWLEPAASGPLEQRLGDAWWARAQAREQAAAGRTAAGDGRRRGWLRRRRERG
ncbi:hypothetical protein Q5424_21285 [Conexibacter sp. JD483]|uniref:hypothetical protein n=1 Tax=unclassified Conexibacter TaxID=2627773 RepID=UPI00272252D4|nr:MULTISPECIES: hypothetical protein [unclassified Conexibacter]MDO8185387.1 hypothetical protein [Conexibacter sp. CPCC 205706]MDO8198437.1 hypothetical protein [Conexibacter sp. CPCC 205762]MDR9371645.1 hypothetical protein [Conexibacter sp. JD483]